jgi:hypothetical protein
MKIIKYLAISLFFLNCKQENPKSKINETELVSNKVSEIDDIYSNESLDLLLKCGKYSFMDGYFTVPDYGCIFKPNSSNIIGNVEIYIVPKTKSKNNSNVELEESKINSMNIDDLKKNNQLFVFIIDKKYLKHNEKMEVPYYPITPYEQIIFKYEKNLWKKLAVLKINKENDSQYEDWKTKNLTLDNSINKNTKLKIEGDFFIKTMVSSVETGDPIDISFYFNFKKEEVTLSIGSNNTMETYCEGSYKINYIEDIIKLEFTGEGTCTSDKDESNFLIKKENDNYFIKSKRFLDFEWKILKSKK